MLSFTLTRVDNNISALLITRVTMGGQATYGVDYTAVVKAGDITTPLALENSLVTDIYAVTFPSGVTSVELICTPLAGRIQPTETVAISLVDTPGRFTVDAAKSSANGTMYFD